MKCFRTACNATRNVICRHTQTGNLYCLACAKAINEHNPGLVEHPTKDNRFIETEPQKYITVTKPGEEVTLTPSDEAALDKAWDAQNDYSADDDGHLDPTTGKSRHTKE